MAPAKPSRAASFGRSVLKLTNRYRVAQGLAKLQLNRRLRRAAQNHSRAMASQDFYSHTGPDGSTAGSRANGSGYAWRTVGENIAAGYTKPKQVVRGWMDSPGHRANILNPAFSEMGVGYMRRVPDPGSVTYGTYWTQLFASPLTSSSDAGVTGLG